VQTDDDTTLINLDSRLP